MKIPEEANTDEYRELLSKKFYALSADEFQARYLAGKFDNTKEKKTLKTLLYWFPGLKAKKDSQQNV